MSGGLKIDSERVLADLGELAARTADERGAQRLCWTPAWREARSLLARLLEEVGAEHEIDEAGNLWAELAGADPGAPLLALGSHLDSVPGGGWLDGALGVMAALGVLRAIAASGEAPPIGVCLVDWADEEGARFGRSLFGSSAFAGTLEPAAVAGLTDAGGERLRDVLSAYGVAVERAPEAGSRLQRIGAYLELHIEQGPRLEASGDVIAAVGGCPGIERHRFRFEGQASHAGTTPMDARRDAGLAAFQSALAIEQVPAALGGVATTGEARLEPGIPTAVAGTSELSVDLRNADGARLAEMLATARSICERVADARGCEVSSSEVWRIDPIRFDERLVELALDACRQVAGSAPVMTSGALHDAAEVARVLPAAMIFCPSIAGISHDRAEDTSRPDLVRAIEAYGAWTAAVIADRAG